MKTLILFGLFMLSSVAGAASIVCEGNSLRVFITTSAHDIKVTVNGESTIADGLVTKDEVDLTAVFATQGEMTVYARIGQNSSGNYVFFKGQRNAVVCR